jgi:hypothetical protein
MSAIHETFEYHLTPRGWVDGTAQLDLGNEEVVSPPEDRVATFEEDRYVGDVHSQIKVTWEQTWRAQDVDLEPLYAKFGRYPEGVAACFRK